MLLICQFYIFYVFPVRYVCKTGFLAHQHRVGLLRMENTQTYDFLFLSWVSAMHKYELQTYIPD